MLERRIESIKVRNYRSLADVEIQLEDLTVLVGENGSGKSNLVDVLRFVRDALTKGLDAAIVERGGIETFIYKNTNLKEFGIKINLSIDGNNALYDFVVETLENNDYEIIREEFHNGDYWYLRADGEFSSSKSDMSVKHIPHSLILPLFSELPEIEPVFQFLSNINAYNIYPDRFRAPQTPLRSNPLMENGENLISTLREIITKYPRNAQSIAEFLSRVIPGIVEENPIHIESYANYLIAQIQHKNGLFNLSQESDGTLRSLGILTALYQMPYLPFIGIEEPEMMLYPQALGLIVDALSESSARSQILVTTHSPDLISRFQPKSLRIVELIEGVTQIGNISDADFEAINEKLFSSGDLLRIGALRRA